MHRSAAAVLEFGQREQPDDRVFIGDVSVRRDRLAAEAATSLAAAWSDE